MKISPLFIPKVKAFFRSLFRSKSARLTTTTTSEYYNMSSSPSLFCCRTASPSSKSGHKSSFPIKASKCSVQAVFRSRSRSNTNTTRSHQNRNQAVCSSSSNSNNTNTTTRMQNTRNTRSRNAPRGEEFLGGGFLSHLEEEFASIDREFLNARKRMTMFEEEGGRGSDAREDLGPSIPSNRTVEKKREIRKERRGENSYSNFHYVESVTTYGGASAGAFRCEDGKRSAEPGTRSSVSPSFCAGRLSRILKRRKCSRETSRARISRRKRRKSSRSDGRRCIYSRRLFEESFVRRETTRKRRRIWRNNISSSSSSFLRRNMFVAV